MNVQWRRLRQTLRAKFGWLITFFAAVGWVLDRLGEEQTAKEWATHLPHLLRFIAEPWVTPVVLAVGLGLVVWALIGPGHSVTFDNKRWLPKAYQPIEIHHEYIVGTCVIIAVILVGSWAVHRARVSVNSQGFTENYPTKDHVTGTVQPPAAKPTEQIVLLKNPLEIIAFRSDYAIALQNDDPKSIFVISLVVVVGTPPMSRSFALEGEIPPGRVYRQELRDGNGITHYRTSRKLADTWAEHMRKVMKLYGACGYELAFFSPNDPSFQQIKANYEQQGASLGYTYAAGILYYRVEGSTTTQEQHIPIAATLVVDNDKCPQ